MRPIWQREGIEGYVALRKLERHVPLYRFYHPEGDHFYTTVKGEFIGTSWEYQGIACYVRTEPANGLVPLHRFYHQNGNDHFYTASEEEKASVIQREDEYKYEGIACYISSTQREAYTPLYRSWNPAINDHFYTILRIQWYDLAFEAPPEVIEQGYKYAPEVRLHPDDQYRPASVEWFLERAELRFNHDTGGIHKLMDMGEVTTKKLVDHSHEVHSLPWHRGKRQYSGQGDSISRYFLQLHPSKLNSTHRFGQSEYFKNGQESWDIPCYYHVRPVEPYKNRWDFQYIFFYAYNGKVSYDNADIFGAGSHEGEWEHISVRVDLEKERIEGIYYGAHGKKDGRWATEKVDYNPGSDRSKYQLNTSGNPIVYSAYHSHASYPGVLHLKRRPLPPDRTKDGGPIWKCYKNLIHLGQRDKPENGQEWIRFTGKWGKIDGDGLFSVGSIKFGKIPVNPLEIASSLAVASLVPPGFLEAALVGNEVLGVADNKILTIAPISVDLPFEGTEGPAYKEWWWSGEPNGPGGLSENSIIEVVLQVMMPSTQQPQWTEPAPEILIPPKQQPQWLEPVLSFLMV